MASSAIFMSNAEGEKKSAARRDSGAADQEVDSSLNGLDREDLTTPIIAARFASNVSGNAAAALRATLELAGVPAVGRLAGAQAHLRSFSLGNSHGRCWSCLLT
jgi:hypothetical protein